MKKIYALVLCCLSATFAHSQFDKGQKILGGGIGFSSNDYGDPADNYYTSNTSTFTFSPSVGWFSKPNKLYGIGLTYGYNSNKTINVLNNSTELTKSHSIGVRFFSQRFFSLTQNLFFTVTGSIGGSYSFGEITSTTNNVENKTKTPGYGVAADLAPGLSYKLSKRLLFDAYLNSLISINYFRQMRKDPSTGNTRTFQKGFNVSSSLSNTNIGNVGLGFRWLLRK